MSVETKEAAARYHRKTLLAVADRLLTEHGYDGMNMNMLAREADYSKATVYVYFESKDEIVRLLCIERLGLLKKELALVVGNDMTVEEKFAEIKNVLDEFVRDDRVYFDFVCASEHADGETDGSRKALSDLVGEILGELSLLAPEEELKRRWYAYYGRVKTERMFA